MSAEPNKAVIQRLFDEVFHQGNFEVIDDLVAEHVLSHEAAEEQVRDSEPKQGIENFKQVVILFQKAFPNSHYPLFDLIAEGDKVVARWGLRGTHRGYIYGDATD